MNWFKNNLANFFTLGNLACGFLGITFVLEGQMENYAFWLMILGGGFDFLDGFVARATKTTSKIGADLDSLADMVTFGVLPGAMIWKSLDFPFAMVGILIPVLSAWRLAKFNNDTRESSAFYGLPSPANALFTAGIYIGLFHDWFQNFEPKYSIQVQLAIAGVVLFMSILMVTDIKLFSNKISDFSIAKYKWHLIVLVLAIALIAIYGYLGVSLAIISYVLISIIATFASPKTAE